MKNSSTSNDLFRRQEEYSKLAFEKGNMLPRRYVFILTNLCNLRCTFCFQERKKREDRMHTDHWMHVLNQIPKGSRIERDGDFWKYRYNTPNMEKAVEEMRKAGQAKADKKSSRVAAEGVISLSISEDNKFANIIEINCETDFVAKDESFLEFVKKISDISLQNFDGNIENLLNSQHQ